MIDVIVTTNPFEIDDYVLHETDNLIAFIRDKFPVWPENARIYQGNVAESCDVTPRDEKSISALDKLDGPIFIVVYPGDLATVLAVSAVAIAILSAAALILIRPPVPELGSSPSANNTLSERSNKARPNSRIPDIFGRVRAIPDLVALPYRIFENNQEIEISYMCLGRGSYAIEDVRDGDTLLGSISGAGAVFYGPDTSPNFGTAQLQIGSDIEQDLCSVVKLNEVNGQTLVPPNNQSYTRNLRFIAPNVIEGNVGEVDFTVFTSGITVNVSGASYALTVPPVAFNASVKFEDGGIIRFDTIDPTAYFTVGSSLSLSNASYSGLDDGGLDYLFVDLLGFYEVTAVTSDSVTLDAPELVNADWDKLVDYPSDETEYKLATLSSPGSSTTIDLDGAFTVLSSSTTQIVLDEPETTNADWLQLVNFPSDTTPTKSVNVSTTGIVWFGWFDLPLEDVAGNKIIFNIAANQGMYGINKDGEQYARVESVEVEFRPIDKDGTVTGSTETATGTLTGSASEKKMVALTIEAMPTFTGRAQVRARRTTTTDLNPEHQAIDSIQWESCYGLMLVDQDHFGDVTTVFTRTYATQSATAIKERKFNCQVVRLIPEWDGSDFVGMEPQTDAAPIICAMALDPYIGNRAIGELNVQQIYDEIEALRDYFGIDEATEFCYTFDDDNMSFEETISTVAETVFSTAYRLGSVIQLYAEMATENSLLLFGHRNKLPKSEVRTVTFGATNDYDGVELTYVSPEDDTQRTIYLPEDQSARNPRKIDTVGIRNENQAMLHAYRAYNKIIYQNTTTQFEALEQAEFLVNNNRILVADNTRQDTKDGYIVEQDGLILTLSQPFEPDLGVDYTIFLQHTNGTVEALECTGGADKWHAVLAGAPAFPLSLGEQQTVVAHYWIVGDNEPRASAFIMSEKEVAGKNTFSITAINYDARYYSNDQDFA